jgi:uncharacterized protein (TIGR02271 family)
MATMQKEEILRQRGEDLCDSEGNKVGTIEEIYLDTETNEPEWALVKAGMFGTKPTFVPIREASREDDGGLRVPYDKSQIKDAPKMDPDGELSQQEEADLYRHYGLDYGGAAAGGGLTEAGGGQAGFGRGTGETAGEVGDTESAAGTTGTAGGTSGTAAGTTGTAGGTSGTAAGTTDTPPGAPTRGGDDAMTRSEEELRVGTTQQERGRVRLRKYVDTEDVQETVPVEREEARVEREPITDDNIDDATSGPDITEGEHEVVLHEEEVVAEKRAVPKERIRLDKDTVTDEHEVSDTVRKERVDVDDRA